MEQALGIRSFGHAHGRPVAAIRIKAGHLGADILTFGAVLRGLWHRDIGHSLVLGLNDAAEYAAWSPYFGAVLGRVANRLGGGRFAVDDQLYQGTRNEDGRNMLHGGQPGFSDRIWTLAAHDETSVTLLLTSLAGENGFPGTVQARARWQLTDDDGLMLDLEAGCDAPTPVNLSAHPYFCLDGSDRIDDHAVQITAPHYTPVDEHAVPTGTIAAVAATALDFRQWRQIGPAQIDLNFCTGTEPWQPLRRVAAVRAGALQMAVSSTQPGLQFYTGDHIRVPVAGLDGRRYASRAGLCLEAQSYPDAPNHPDFPNTILRPGERYRQRILYRFSKVPPSG